MKYTALLITSLFLAFAWPAQATTLTVDFTEPYKPERPEAVPRPLGVDLIGGTHQYLFNELNGTEFLGQKISLDINFSGASTGEQFIRIFSLTSQRLELNFDFGTIITTPIPDSGLGFSGLVDNLNGYVTGKNGKEIKQVDPVVGRGAFYGGLGIFPILDPASGGGPYNPNIKTPLDIYGAHLEFTLGNYPGTYLTQFGFMVRSNFEGFIPELIAPLGMGPSDYLPKDIETFDEAIYWWKATREAATVPDSGSTLAMFGLALVAIGGFTRFRSLA